MAADQGHLEAQYQYGLASLNGNGGKPDYREAALRLRAAADAGHVGAQTRLAELYEPGRGVPQDFVQAHMWANLASIEGSADAVTTRDRVTRLMTREQIAQAQEMARGWRPKQTPQAPAPR
jgi:TPR repeat protein